MKFLPLLLLTLYICGGFILIPISSLLIKQYVHIDSLSQGVVYFDNATEYIVDGTKSVRIKTYGHLYDNPNTNYNVTIAYPPDTTYLTYRAYDVNKYITHIKSTSNKKANINTNIDGLSYTTNIKNIGAWILALVLFGQMYVVALLYIFYHGMILFFNGSVDLIRKYFGTNTYVKKWLPTDTTVYFDPTSSSGWNVANYGRNSISTETGTGILNVVNQTV
jgi:hypothetical protein